MNEIFIGNIRGPKGDPGIVKVEDGSISYNKFDNNVTTILESVGNVQAYKNPHMFMMPVRKKGFDFIFDFISEKNGTFVIDVYDEDNELFSSVSKTFEGEYTEKINLSAYNLAPTKIVVECTDVASATVTTIKGNNFASKEDLETKADKEDTYTKKEVDEKIALNVFEKQFLKEDWVDGVLQIPYEEHQKQNPVVSVFCHRYDYEVYEAEGICEDSLCDGSVMVYPIHPETKKEVAFSSWLTPYAGTVSSENYCTKCGISYVSQPHPYSVKNVEIFCPVAMDEEKNITLQSDIAFSGKVVMK